MDIIHSIPTWVLVPAVYFCLYLLNCLFPDAKPALRDATAEIPKMGRMLWNYTMGENVEAYEHSLEHHGNPMELYLFLRACLGLPLTSDELRCLNHLAAQGVKWRLNIMETMPAINVVRKSPNEPTQEVLIVQAYR